jgi:phage terminase large subunit-like protein
MSSLEPFRQFFAARAAEGLDTEQITALLDDDRLLQMLELLEAERDQERFGKFHDIYPTETNRVGEAIYYARDLYPKHMEFFEAGAKYRERCAMAANRVGKTFGMGGYEMACHLTGRYPEWWIGKRFRVPVRAWACGKTNETTRDIVQNVLLGDIKHMGARKIVDGSGMIPREYVRTGPGDITWKQGVADLVDTVKISHVSGGYSKLGLKSYQQGRGAFEGVAQHVIWDDEEPPLDVWSEQLMRLATTKGIMMLTFTPLEGMSEVVQQFLPAEMRPTIT